MSLALFGRISSNSPLNGDTSDLYGTTAQLGQSITWTANVNSVNSATIYFYGSGSASLTINGAAYSVPASPDSFSHTIDVSETNSLTVVLGYVDGVNYVYFNHVEFDGKLLVDTGARSFGDSRVTTTTPKRGAGTISAINGSVVV